MSEDMGFKSIISIFKSMKFGLLLLGLLGIIAVVGSTIPQGQSDYFYLNNFSEGKARLIISFGFNDIYNSLYFKALFTALCINLSLCSVLRLRSIINNLSKVRWSHDDDKIDSLPIKKLEDIDGFIEERFQSWGHNRVQKKMEGKRSIYYSKRLSIGYFGSWLIHLGLLIVIIAYAYGQYGNFTSAVYGIPGSIQPIENTEMRAAIKDFRIDLRDDGGIHQYYTQLELLDQEDNILVEEEIYVNNPLRYKGYSFYQTATGWAANIEVTKNGMLLEEELMYEGTTYISEAENVAIQFNRLYPDYIETASGMASLSHEPNNPKILYSIFYRGNRVDMNVASPDEAIEWNEYEFILKDIERYTYLQINKMPGKLVALAGSILIMLGLYLSFYLKPRYAVAVVEGNSIIFYSNEITNAKGVYSNTTLQA